MRWWLPPSATAGPHGVAVCVLVSVHIFIFGLSIVNCKRKRDDGKKLKTTTLGGGLPLVLVGVDLGGMVTRGDVWTRD